MVPEGEAVWERNSMEQWKDMLAACANERLVKMVLSNPREKSGVVKIEIRPVVMKDVLLFQAGAYTKTQVQHYNLTAEELYEQVGRWMENMRQMLVLHPAGGWHVLVSKKGKITAKRTGGCEETPRAELAHNRKKQYILQPEVPVPFLVDLGVQTKDGKIVQQRYDKFRQINRFLEFIADIVPELPKNRELLILDFGCGKSYLTFAMYYYLHELQGYDVRIVGLDLKKDVIERCQALAQRYGYEKLSFLHGDIANYDEQDQVDMVVTLHACDTATDFALARAVNWGAKVILSVPCCQHELNKQLQSELLAPITKYGLLKERMAALLTDGIRANLLEQAGYRVQVLEFIDMEHTPKNILLRAVRRKVSSQTSKKETKTEDFVDAAKTEDFIGAATREDFVDAATKALLKELHAAPTLAQLLRK